MSLKGTGASGDAAVEWEERNFFGLSFIDMRVCMPVPVDVTSNREFDRDTLGCFDSNEEGVCVLGLTSSELTVTNSEDCDNWFIR